MLFNSLSFAIFLPVVYLLYWAIPKQKIKIQNLLILISSYFFYACWDWRFLFLLIFSTLLDYFTGLKMANSKSHSNTKLWFWLSIIINLGFLSIFKYYNFFAESFADFASIFGWNVSPFFLDIILPVGISFYTFHGLSYVIDIYNKKITAEKNFIDYAVFVSFFPLLVAGPIERATHLLPQIKKIRVFDYRKSVDGLRQILWGLLKKIVIADNCAIIVNEIFNNYETLSGSTLALGAVLFAFQIYGDFSGYSDIALGTARLFGFELLKNFSFPYFSRDIAEFWRRWHISLSSWFKDYLYIPLGGSKGGTMMRIRNTFIIFVVSGFWHGANWTFIVWGALNALFIIPSIIFKTNRNNIEIVAKDKLFPTFSEFFQIITTFSLTCIAWIFFRSENLEQAITYLKKIFSPSILSSISVMPKTLLATILIFLTIEWMGRTSKYAIEELPLKWPTLIRYAFYLVLIFMLFWFGVEDQQFIYFQF